MSASIEHVPLGKVYILNYVDGSNVLKIPYGILTVAQGNCQELLQTGVCAWIEEVENSTEYDNIVDKWLYNHKQVG